MIDNKTLTVCKDFAGASVVKNPPAVWEMWVCSLGQEDPLNKEMATHSSMLSWEIPWIEEPTVDRRATVHGVAESDMT